MVIGSMHAIAAFAREFGLGVQFGADRADLVVEDTEALLVLGDPPGALAHDAPYGSARDNCGVERRGDALPEAIRESGRSTASARPERDGAV
jgi:hypothetical protein